MVRPKGKIEAATRMLEAQGHVVETQQHDGKGSLWCQIDGRILVSWEEMRELADGVYSLTELEDLFIRREVEHANEHADELAHKVIGEWFGYFEDGHADALPTEFRELKDRAFGYQNAKRNADNERNTFRLVRERTDEPDAVLDALLEKATSQERAAHEALLKAYRNLLEKKLPLRAAGAKVGK
jgi:hypothetical protein